MKSRLPPIAAAAALMTAAAAFAGSDVSARSAEGAHGPAQELSVFERPCPEANTHGVMIRLLLTEGALGTPLA
ncbi:hypothetical protein [Altericroceibacterium xinjiangense]|uniref:hypothetical protein n=1 Tax=Altericroceibacterium xinjiangense TaxID=762261 RepID=UPI000F7F1FFF|nr:hypothetical protein [Altericroceibacterium xinjiangense]